MTTPNLLKLARDALDAALFDLRRDDDERRSAPIVTRALAAIDAMPATAQAAPAPAALLVRDLAASLGVKPLAVCKALADLGHGQHSINMAVPAAVVGAIERHFAAAPAPAAVPAGWRIDAVAPDGYAVHAPSGAVCIVHASDDSPRIVPTVVLADLCRDLLATTAAPAVAAPEALPANMKACVLSAIERGIQVLEEVVTGRTLPRHAIYPVIERLAFAKKALKGEAPLQTSPTPTTQEQQ